MSLVLVAEVLHKPEHLLDLGDVTFDTSHIGASGVDLLEAYDNSPASSGTFTCPTPTPRAATSTGSQARKLPWW